MDLATQINAIKGPLIANENDYGGYLHDERFVAFFNGGGMKYEGGTTTAGGALAHETFHTDSLVVLCSRNPWQRHTPTTRMTAAGPAPTRCAG